MGSIKIFTGGSIMSVLDLIKKRIKNIGNPKHKELLEELLRLAEIGDRMRWIPITESIPEVGNKIDICLIDHLDYGKGRIIDTTVYKDDTGLYFDDGSESPIDLEDITHWRPSENDRPESEDKS